MESQLSIEAPMVEGLQNLKVGDIFDSVNGCLNNGLIRHLLFHVRFMQF